MLSTRISSFEFTSFANKEPPSRNARLRLRGCDSSEEVRQHAISTYLLSTLTE